jgi:hypothetical protein
LSDHEAVNIVDFITDRNDNPHKPVYIFMSEQQVIDAAHAAGSRAKSYAGAHTYLAKSANILINMGD